MKYEVKYGNGVIVLPKASVLEKLGDVGAAELKVLIRLLSDETLLGDIDQAAVTLAAELGLSDAEAESCLSYWRGAGVICQGKEKKRKAQRHTELPSYTGEELSSIIDEQGLRDVIDECQSIVGKIFNITEYNRIAALNSYLGLDAEFILLLFSYCAQIGKKSLKYIEKTAYELYDNGIDSTDKLEKFIINEESRHTLENQLRKLFGIGDRSFTPSEKKHFCCWHDEYGYGLDVISEAYNITVEKTGKLSLPYLSKILENWNSKSLRSIEDIRSALSEYEKKKEATTQSQSSYDVDEFFEAALKRSKDKILNKS